MIGNPTFLESEKNAPLLNMNIGDYLQKERVQLLEKRAPLWRKLMLGEMDIEKEPRQPVEMLETPRIIYLDAERTFMKDENRKFHVQFLTRALSHFKGDYSQALSYVAGFLLLVLDEVTVLEIVLKLRNDKNYLTGYWKHEDDTASTDAHVLQHLVKKFFPQLYDHFEANFPTANHYPETYAANKWFAGLFIQSLPFEALYPFFDGFLERGYKFMFQFALALVDSLKDELMQASDPATFFELLRLDPKRVSISNTGPQPNEKIKRINAEQLVKHALDFNVDDVDFAKLRHDIYENVIKKRLEAARANAKQQQEDDDDEDGEDCEICRDMFPELLCKDCNLKICEECHDEEKGSHKKTHKTVPYEPADGADKDDSDVDDLSSQLNSKAKIKE